MSGLPTSVALTSGKYTARQILEMAYLVTPVLRGKRVKTPGPRTVGQWVSVDNGPRKFFTVFAPDEGEVRASSVAPLRVDIGMKSAEEEFYTVLAFCGLVALAGGTVRVNDLTLREWVTLEAYGVEGGAHAVGALVVN